MILYSTLQSLADRKQFFQLVHGVFWTSNFVPFCSLIHENFIVITTLKVNMEMVKKYTYKVKNIVAKIFFLLLLIFKQDCS